MEKAIGSASGDRSSGIHVSFVIFHLSLLGLGKADGSVKFGGHPHPASLAKKETASLASCPGSPTAAKSPGSLEFLFPGLSATEGAVTFKGFHEGLC
jgi:hypothetical protein